VWVDTGVAWGSVPEQSQGAVKCVCWGGGSEGWTLCGGVKGWVCGTRLFLIALEKCEGEKGGGVGVGMETLWGQQEGGGPGWG
jgi:hypothetical protein